MSLGPDIGGSGFYLPSFAFTTGALSGTTAAANVLTGQPLCIVNSTTNGGSLTTRTAALMMGDSGLGLGATWWVLLVNSGGAGTLTLAAGSNVTVSGTATCITVTGRLFLCTVNTATTITMTGQTWALTATGLAFTT